MVAATGSFWVLFVLGLVVLAAVVVIDVAILVILSHQKRDYFAMRRVLAAIANLAVAMEGDQRRTRHAVKNLASTLKMQSVAAALEESPMPGYEDGEEPSQPTVIALERLQRVKDQTHIEEEEHHA